ncbi:unnamed protein product [Closterium sp. NIES-65]|nr:unnamed protein product [Closterium sp. NIES-65]
MGGLKLGSCVVDPVEEGGTGEARLGTREVMIGGFVLFRWFGQMRDVQQFPNKQAFDSCDFSRADPAGGADVITVVSAGEGAEEEDESLQRLRALRQVVGGERSAAAAAHPLAPSSSPHRVCHSILTTYTFPSPSHFPSALSPLPPPLFFPCPLVLPTPATHLLPHPPSFATVAVRDLKDQSAASAAVLAGYEQWHADVAGRVCGNQQELMSRMEAVEALAGKVYKRMNWTSSVVKSNLQHLRAGKYFVVLRMEMEHLRNQLSAVTRSYEGLCEELEVAGLEFDCEMEEIRRIDGDVAAEGGVEARCRSHHGVCTDGWDDPSASAASRSNLHRCCVHPGRVSALASNGRPLPVMVGFLQGNPVSHWSGGVNLWKPPAVKPGDILVFQWFAETHDVQRFKNIFAFKTCAFFNAVPLTSASQFGMRLFQVKPAHAGKTLFFGSSVGKDCQRGVKIAIPVS